MHIQDFHSKLTSTNEASPLFEALRSLSRVEDPGMMVAIDADPVVRGEWPQWPTMDAHASCTASAGV
jgi:hypothetical protein